MRPPELGFTPTVPALLRRAAELFGEHEYVVTLDERWTYAAAECGSAGLARSMLATGVGKGTRVGLFLAPGGEFLLSWLAASRIGAVVVPLSTLYTARELHEVARAADLDLVIAAPRVLGIDVAALFENAFDGLADSVEGSLWLTAVPFLRRIWFTADSGRAWATTVDLAEPARQVPAEVLAAVETEVTPADTALIVHTSGTSAAPKGVVHSHGTLVRQTSIVEPALRGFAGGRPIRVLCAMPFFWIGGMLNLAGALHAPVTILTLPRLQPGPALELLDREDGIAVMGFPTFAQRLTGHPDYATRDLSAVRPFLDGPADLSMHNVPDGRPFHRAMSETAGSFFATDVRVSDPETGQPVPTGQEGELLVRGPGFMQGLNKREPWEITDADGWYHTGDRVYRVDGDPRIFFVGRYSELIKSSGVNVSPKEVEAVLDELPEVRHSFVLGLPDEVLGEAVTAVVVATDPATWDETAMAAQARTLLSSYKVPTRWVLMTETELPMLATGKIDRRRLRELIDVTRSSSRQHDRRGFELPARVADGGGTTP